MDGKTAVLQEKLERLLLEAAEVSVDLDRAEGVITGVPHFSTIELRAHELGRQLSRRVQERHMRELAAVDIPKAPCPQCGQRCELVTQKRKVTSIDGEIEITELAGRCPCCRKAFFPSASDAGARRAAVDADAGDEDRDLRSRDAQLRAGHEGDARGGQHAGFRQDDRARGARRGGRTGRAPRRRPLRRRPPSETSPHPPRLPLHPPSQPPTLAAEKNQKLTCTPARRPCAQLAG